MPTFSTTNDPNLKVVEKDNGSTWAMYFYVGNTLIDYINLEHGIVGPTIHPLVLKLPVYDEINDYKYIGTVAERLNNAI